MVWPSPPRCSVGLLFLQLVNLPLARSLVRLPAPGGSAEREALLERALEPARPSAGAIAADPHDGVVQDLVGVSLRPGFGRPLARQDRRRRLRPPARARARGRPDPPQRPGAAHAARRHLPAEACTGAGLTAALADLAATGCSRGVATAVAVAPALELRDATARLFYRCAQESLRNTFKHGRAGQAWITLTADGEWARMEVGDDGDGFDPALMATRAREGHIGLHALTDLVRGAGGRLELTSSPGAGTVVTVSLPR